MGVTSFAPTSTITPGPLSLRLAGKLLNKEAQAGNLRGVKRVTGRAEIKGSGPNPDYALDLEDGGTGYGDLYEPFTDSWKGVHDGILDKASQADTIFVWLGSRGRSGNVTTETAREIGEYALQVSQKIRRVVFMRGDDVILQLP